jgi:cytochrome c oxidase subunit IV
MASRSTKIIFLFFYFNVCTVNLVQFITQTNKSTTYVLIIFYISKAFLHVSMHLHNLQEVLTLYFANVTKLLNLQLNKIITLLIFLSNNFNKI